MINLPASAQTPKKYGNSQRLGLFDGLFNRGKAIHTAQGQDIADKNVVDGIADFATISMEKSRLFDAKTIAAVEDTIAANYRIATLDENNIAEFAQTTDALVSDMGIDAVFDLNPVSSLPGDGVNDGTILMSVKFPGGEKTPLFFVRKGTSTIVAVAAVIDAVVILLNSMTAPEEQLNIENAWALNDAAMAVYTKANAKILEAVAAKYPQA